MNNRTFVCFECRTTVRAIKLESTVHGPACRVCKGPTLESVWTVPTKRDHRGWEELQDKVEQMVKWKKALR